VNLSEDQILALAPDEASKKAGKDLANPSKWSNTGINEKAMWGECQGSGKNPYRTQVDLKSVAVKCSCPSRKFPCKHGLGMLLLYSRQKNLFSQNEVPAWVKEWIDKREEKAEKKQEAGERPVDPEAQAKRQQQRLKKISGGIDELKLVIKDIVRNGIINLPEKGPALFENLAKRMIDSQAQGLAVMVRELAEINYFKENWQTEFIDQLIRIYLVTESYGKIENLPEQLADEIRSLIGFTQSTEELKKQEGVKDEWFVLGKTTEQQEQLMVQRNWLFGVNSGKYALVLQFYVRTAPPEINLTPGTCIEAELSFYKSICPLRAMIKETGKLTFPKNIKGFGNWKNLSDFETNQRVQSPFVINLPFIINSVTLAKADNIWFLNDEAGNSMRFNYNEKQLNKILAVTGGRSFSLSMVGSGDQPIPVGLFMNNNYIIL